MKLRSTFGTVLAAAAGVLGMAAGPATAATVSPSLPLAAAHTAGANTTAPKAPALTTAFSATSVGYGTWVTVTVHLGATATNRNVTLYARNWGNGATFVAGSGTVNSAGNLVVRYWDAQTRTFWANFSGDASDAAVNTAGVAVHVASAVSAANVQAYGHAPWAGNSVALYHKGATAYLDAKVTPNEANQDVTVNVQVYYQNKWVEANTPQKFALDANSELGVKFTNWTSGYVFRTQVSYAGNLANGASSSAWQYWTLKN